MFKKVRQDYILKMLRSSEQIEIKDLADHFGVSTVTIRRDLREIEETGLIKRVYGGAVAQDTADAKRQPFFNTRVSDYQEEKAAIAIAAAAYVQEGDVVMLDIGTTCLEVAKQLKHMRGITILTTSLPVLFELADADLDVYSLGGKLRGGEMALCGSLALQALKDFCITKAFIGVGGITLERGFTDYNRDSADLCAAVVSRAEQVFVVSDSSKFGRNTSSVISGLSSAHTIITDRQAPEAIVAAIRRSGVEVVTV